MPWGSQTPHLMLTFLKQPRAPLTDPLQCHKSLQAPYIAIFGGKISTNI